MNQFYYTGAWHRPITLYDLTAALCIFFDIKDISKELNVLLLETFMDGYNWLKSLGYDVSLVALPEKKGTYIEDEPKYIDDRTDEQKRRSSENAKRTENLVFKHLKEMYKTKYSPSPIITENNYSFEIADVKILWHNAAQESFKDKDFTITENGIEKYIEVKSTQESQSNTTQIFFSTNEWGLMKGSKSRYFLARVFESLDPKNIVFVDMQHIDIKNI
jgi:hypothetical protein